MTRYAILIALLAASCRCEEEAPTADRADAGARAARPDAAAEAAPPAFPYRQFDDEAQALAAILDEAKPGVIGFGEYHQIAGTSRTLSSIARFTAGMLPALAPRASDLVVETWMSMGRCGKAEKKVTEKFDEEAERPAETADETVLLLRRANALGVAPHILTVKCEDYEKLLAADGGLDYFAFLELVGRSLGDEAAKAAAAPRPAGEPGKILVVYGGAGHNDVAPRPGFEAISYAARLAGLGRGPYVEVDLLVPELVAVSGVAREEPWFPLVAELASPDKVALIDRGGGSYIVLSRSGVATATAAPPPGGGRP